MRATAAKGLGPKDVVTVLTKEKRSKVPLWQLVDESAKVGDARAARPRPQPSSSPPPSPPERGAPADFGR